MTYVALVVAGIVAGIVGSAGGITSLVAYPALIFAGLTPLSANVSATVAILGSGLSSSWRAWRAGSLRGLERAHVWLAVLFVAVSLVGGLAVLLTPAQAFAKIAPLLVAIGSGALLAYPVLVRRAATRAAGVGIVLALVSVAAYNGYFGAGSGILVLALIVVSLRVPLALANDRKNALILVADAVPSVAFVASGLVAWWAVVPLGVGALVGGSIGPEVARRVPAHVMRVVIGVLGLGFALWLALFAS